ncbi:TenA family transcriptional regulator [Noviherbaspirillum galbum]|uniref:Iron-containing redox enzyme family protein n=1 Tax=Noviherbaspirillum galbum TaxID=2709383 RepID=A0A6B3SW22_9BURK|nr:iron-containing redox enzyme family protein [Noviherbaspirillum galbum]NEX62582.1 iron-containing redox enzyme family protein [Noviherbaspirillum galbum]
MSFFIHLLETTDQSRRDMEALPKVQDMLNGRMSQETYLDFLRDLYHIVWHFCPIMAAAASRCDDAYLDVRLHLYHNIDEEKGHENMVLDDLVHFGADPDAIRASRPSYSAQAMIAYNYYASERIHPCCVLGMLYVLEVISSVYGGQVASSIAAGLERQLPQGFSFLESHASMDLDHMARLNALLQKIDDRRVQQVVIDAINMNFYLFSQFLSA